MYEIRDYQNDNGKRPFVEWLKALKDVQARAVILARLGRIKLGNLGDHKNVGDGVNELRIDFGPGYRVYFGKEGRSIVLLLIGGNKGTQQRDIQKAKKYWRDYLS